MQDIMVPILRSCAVLRPEYFGGLLLNYSLPPELRLDHIRFRIALMCNGAHTLREIKDYFGCKLIHSREYSDYLVKSTLNQFDELKLLDWKSEKLSDPHNFSEHFRPLVDNQHYLSAPTTVIWEITRNCNLRCMHCFSNSGNQGSNELKINEIKKIIDDLAKRKIFYIDFTGGEPLLRPDIFEILNYTSGKKISFSLSTNGYLVNEEIVELLKRTNVFQVQISIDGIDKVHDRFRGVNGSFQQALKAIRLLKDAEIGVTISTTANKTNLNQISNIIDLAMNIGATAFKTTLFMPVGRGKSNQPSLNLERDDVRRLAILMKEKGAEVKGRLRLYTNSTYPWLLEERGCAAPTWMRSDNISCAAGNSSIFVTSDGNVVPCPFLRELTMGNLLRDSFNQIWESNVLDTFRLLRPEDLKGKCGNCEYNGFECYGGCRAAALAYNGDILAEDPFCYKMTIA